MEPRRRFRFLKELSEGAFGKVYMAEMITGDNFRSIVAIKLLHGKWLGHEEIVQRSRDEARVLGLLHHRNIIRVEDLTSINGQCAVVMEFLDGVDCKTLVNYTKERGEIIPRKVCFEVIAAVASALEAAYNQAPLQGGEPLHLIHRDIKPSNVMVTKAGEVKVLDFGTAQAKFDEREAHTQALAFGSAAYMAPERLLGDPDAPSGDVFSLGVTLYEMLAQGPFGKVHIRPEKYEADLEQRIAGLPLDDLGPERATQLRQVMHLLLGYDSSERPTARQVVDLMEALADEVHDGTMRRFCRAVVSPCRDMMDPSVAPDDPLTGSTLFEDRTTGGHTLGELRAELADSGDRDNAWVEPAPPNPFTVPADLATDDTPPEYIDDDARGDFDPAPSGHAVGATSLASPPTMAPLEDMDVAPAPPRDLREPELPPEPGWAPMDGLIAASGIETADPFPAGASVSGGSVSGGAAEPAPPISVGRAAVPRIVEPGTLEPRTLEPSSGKPRTVEPRTVEPAPARSGGGKGVIAAVAVVVVLAVVCGGGLVIARSMGLLGGGDGDAVDAGTPPVTAGVGSEKGAPGGRIEVGAMDGSNGAVSLSLQPEGSASVSVTSMTGFKQDWDGSGQLELVGLAPGTYKTKVAPEHGSTVRGTLEVKAGKTCSYVFPTTEGGTEWQASGCE